MDYECPAIYRELPCWAKAEVQYAVLCLRNFEVFTANTKGRRFLQYCRSSVVSGQSKFSCFRVSLANYGSEHNFLGFE